jgi:hypothetical protein
MKMESSAPGGGADRSDELRADERRDAILRQLLKTPPQQRKRRDRSESQAESRKRAPKSAANSL